MDRLLDWAGALARADFLPARFGRAVRLATALGLEEDFARDLRGAAPDLRVSTFDRAPAGFPDFFDVRFARDLGLAEAAFRERDFGDDLCETASCPVARCLAVGFWLWAAPLPSAPGMAAGEAAAMPALGVAVFALPLRVFGGGGSM